MSFSAIFSLTLVLAWRKLLASKFTLLLALAFPILLFWLGRTESSSLAMSAFLFVWPHFSLVLAQDMVRSEVDSGALENLLFVNGDFRNYLWLKNFVLTSFSFIYSITLFILLVAWEMLDGSVDRTVIMRFLISLVVGLYYIAVAGLVSYYLKSGSNALAFILVQVFVLIASIASVTSRPEFIDYIEKGTFPTLKAKLMFHSLVFVFPNIIVIEKFNKYIWQAAAGFLLALACQRLLARRLELKK